MFFSILKDDEEDGKVLKGNSKSRNDSPLNIIVVVSDSITMELQKAA
ncbi:hypothetical protein ABID23_000501 [Bartonella silvatica]|uniref:Uncharacterized protein n=1 Tax=Bartonella silvatica TaxID=357760 RepID=A0ABV2HFV6_9HYPH